MRAWLQANDYRAAPVSIDASDWYYDQVFSAWLAQGNSDKAKQVKQAYIAHLLQRAAYYDQLAQQLLGRRPARVGQRLRGRRLAVRVALAGLR